MGIDVTLTPELERFVISCVAAGRFENASEVIRTGLRMLQGLEQERSAFLASLEAATLEAQQSGFRTAQQVEESVAAIIEEAGRRA